ncbi:MAG TPA: nucleotidyltransferase family protein [Gemmataceae bacterium]|jgi:molybdenum cofactor cytidylyltransferase
MRFAILPAAGKSSRMGRPKLALPLGERTILEHVVAALRQAEVEHILVVLGPHVAELTALATSAGARVCPLAEPTAGMRETVEHGLRWIEQRFHPLPDDTWLLAPADHPALDASVVKRLGSAFAAEPEFSIIIPTYQGRRGHPTLFAWKHVAAIHAYPAELGLNTYIRQSVAETLEVAVESPTILWDMDTPEDYEWLRQNWPMSPGLPRKSRIGSDINSQ